MSEPDSTATEAQLRRFLSGDDAQGNELFLKLWTYLVRIARNHRLWPSLRRSFEPEDVAGSLWETLFRKGNLGQFIDRGAGSLRAYLCVCIDSHLHDLLRSVCAQKRGGGSITYSLNAGEREGRDALAVPHLDPGVSTLIDYAQWERNVHAALTDREREVWDLRVGSGLGFSRVGDELSTTEAATRALFGRARTRLIDKGLLPSEF